MATTTLVCKQCNFENEPERVYCHNCGAKLDRSLLPPEATKRTDPVVVQERVRRIIRPKRGSSGRFIRSFLVSVSLAAVIALVFAIMQPPEGIPEVNKDAAMQAPAITDDMDAMVSQAGPAVLRYAEDQVNAFLQSTIHGKREESSGVVKFERTYVHFDEGVVRVTYVQSIFGWPIYATSGQSVTIDNGQVIGKPVSGSIGRLAIPAQILPYLGGIFSPLWKVLERDKNTIAKMGAIKFHRVQDKGQVEMLNKAAVVSR